jgi:DNA-directed RNA polymerase I subunit RPA43
LEVKFNIDECNQRTNPIKLQIMAKRKSDQDLKSLPKKRKVQNGNVLNGSGLTNPKNENGISECFQKVSASLYLSLAPLYIGEPSKGICVQHLDPLLMTYFESAGGVVVGHYNLKLHGDSEPTEEEQDSTSHRPVIAKIQYDSPFAFTWVSVDLLVWKPVPGDVIEGWISLQSPSHMGLLVHDIFNATIKRDSIPKDWKFIPNEEDEVVDLSTAPETPETPSLLATPGSMKPKSFRDPKSLGYWVDGNGKRVDGKVRFTVKSFNVSGRLVSVQGSLLGRGEVKQDLTQMGQEVEDEEDAKIKVAVPEVIDSSEHESEDGSEDSSEAEY